jgi:putative transposase
MKRLQFREVQVIAMLREQQAGVPTAEVRGRHCVSASKFYKWKAKWLKALEGENRRLNRRLVDTMLDNVALHVPLSREKHPSSCLTMWMAEWLSNAPLPCTAATQSRAPRSGRPWEHAEVRLHGTRDRSGNHGTIAAIPVRKATVVLAEKFDRSGS